MRKLLILLLCTTTLGLVSCKKETIIQEVPGSRTFNYTIQPNEWVSGDAGRMWSSQLRVDEIDDIAMDDEGVLVYITHPAMSTSYLQIPATWNANSYSYELYEGGIQIDLQSSDVEFDVPAKPTSPILVKIVLIPSEYVD